MKNLMFLAVLGLLLMVGCASVPTYPYPTIETETISGPPKGLEETVTVTHQRAVNGQVVDVTVDKTEATMNQKMAEFKMKMAIIEATREAQTTAASRYTSYQPYYGGGSYVTGYGAGGQNMVYSTGSAAILANQQNNGGLSFSNPPRAPSRNK